APAHVPWTSRVPRGVWFAVALAIVVLAIAAWQATGSSSSSSPDDVARLDPNATEPAGNPLQGGTAGDLVGRPFPAVPLVDMDGNPRSIDDYAGRPLVVNFWAANCVPCRTEMPSLEQLHQQYGDRVTFVGVDSGESVEAGRPAAAISGVT